MTLFSNYWLRGSLLAGVPQQQRHFEVSPNATLLAKCHWQRYSNPKTPVIVLVHGLTGSADSPIVVGLAHLAWHAGFNVVRLNQRNCGGSEHLSRGLYHSGLSQDFVEVATELQKKDGFERIWLVGYSMGGNLVLNAGLRHSPGVRGVVAICPSADLQECADALEQRDNFIYQNYFVTQLKKKLREKVRAFPTSYSLRHLDKVRSIRQFDEWYTAPDAGFTSASDYYKKTSSAPHLNKLAVPALVIAAQDDPFIPFPSIARACKNNAALTFLGPQHGGHCGFFSTDRSSQGRFWAEKTAIDFVTHHESSKAP